MKKENLLITKATYLAVHYAPQDFIAEKEHQTAPNAIQTNILAKDHQSALHVVKDWKELAQIVDVLRDIITKITERSSQEALEIVHLVPWVNILIVWDLLAVPHAMYLVRQTAQEAKEHRIASVLDI